jgi:hypothetical protein
MARERAKNGHIILRLKVSEIDVAELLVHEQLLSPEYTRRQLEAALVFFLDTWRTRVRSVPMANAA